MKCLYLDCFSGISGDMAVGALVDLGVKPSALEWELSKLDIGDFHMHFDRRHRHAVEGVKFSIHEGATHQHEEDEEHGHGSEHHRHEHEGHEHAHEHGHECHHEHGEHGEHDDHGHAHAHSHDEHEGLHHHPHHEHGEHAHEHSREEHEHEAGYGTAAHPPQVHDRDHGAEMHHAHAHHSAHEHERAKQHHEVHAHGRSYRQIRDLLSRSELSEFAKTHALGIFRRIAEAEAKIHGVPVEDVSFHEVGALDSIADAVCVCVGLEALGVEKVFVSQIHDGQGWIDCAHGRYPIPAPATLEILKGIPVGQIDEPHELITPTGAAILAEFGESFGLMPRMAIEKIGYGIGSRKLESRPNVLRAVLGEPAEG